MSIDIETFRSLLVRRRAELLAQSDATTQDRAPVQLDQQSVGRLSRMDAMQAQAMAQAAQRQREAELAQISAALKRIEDGDYGVCDGCGEPIARGRLAVNPAARLCVACAQR